MYPAAPIKFYQAHSPSQLDVLGMDSDTLCMDASKVGVLKEVDQVGLRGFL